MTFFDGLALFALGLVAGYLVHAILTAAELHARQALADEAISTAAKLRTQLDAQRDSADWWKGN